MREIFFDEKLGETRRNSEGGASRTGREGGSGGSGGWGGWEWWVGSEGGLEW